MPTLPLASATLPLFADAPQPAAPALARLGRLEWVPPGPSRRAARPPGPLRALPSAAPHPRPAPQVAPAPPPPGPAAFAALRGADSQRPAEPTGLAASAAPVAPVAASTSLAPVALPPRPPGAVPSLRATPPPDPATLHPLVWRAHQLGRQAVAVSASGWATLDAQLPGGGWPHRALTELLLPHPGVGEVRLLAHALAAVQRAGRLVMLFDPPAQLCAWALAALGIEPEPLLVIHTRADTVGGERGARAHAGGASASASASASAGGGDSLWALEQALKSGHVGAVLAWLPPRLRIERLRRLQLAAAAHHGPAFVLREPTAAQQPTPAPLRLLLAPAGGDQLTLQLLKRRGPPLEQPLQLRLPAVLGLAAARRAQAAAGADTQGHAAPQPSPAMAAAGPAQSQAAAWSPLRAAAFVNLGG